MIANGLHNLLQPGLGADYKPWDDYWYQPVGSGSSLAGVAVTAASAMNVSAFFACTRVIAETMGYLPWFTYRTRPDGGRDRAPEHPLYPLLHDQPNRWQTAFEWKETIAGHIIMRGKHYSRIIPRDDGYPVGELVPIHPDRVTEEKLPNGNKRYKVRNAPGESVREETLLPDEMLYIPGMWGGMSILEAARETLGEALAAQRYSARSLANGVRTSGFLQHPKTLSDPARKSLREQWTELYAGPMNAGKTVILEEDMKYQAVSMSNEDAQFLQGRLNGVVEIARDFRMPLIMIQEQEKSTSWGTGVEHQQIGFVVFTMLPWCARYEKRGNIQLLPGAPNFFTEFEVDALLRGDAKSAAEALQIERQNGIVNGNEWRRLRNRNPVAAGEPYWRPANMVPWDTPVTSAGQMVGAPSNGAIASDPRKDAYARVLAGQIVRKETERVKSLAKRYADDGLGWKAEVEGFYAKLTEEIAERCYVDPATASTYAAGQRDRLLEVGVGAVEAWEQGKIEELTNLMMEAD